MQPEERGGKMVVCSTIGFHFLIATKSLFFTLDGANYRQYLHSVEGGKINSLLDLASAVFFFFFSFCNLHFFFHFENIVILLPF